MQEIWRDVVWYEWYYQVSSKWRIRRIRNWKIPRFRNNKNFLNNKWYSLCVFCVNGKTNTFLVHRIMAQAFIPNPENKLQVNHINWIKSDNIIENLEWCTAQENIRHAWRNGLMNTPKVKNRDYSQSHLYRKVWKYDLNGNYITSYNSLKDAAINNNTSQQCIYKSASANTVSGWFLWKYE